jgi:hypothetical protein
MRHGQEIGILTGKDGKDKKNRGIARHHSRTQRSYSLGSVSGSSHERTDHVVRVVDLSVIGVGIESSERIEPGFVWFKERVGGHKYGVLTWSRKSGDHYRAGITFVTLSRTDELYVQDQARHSPPLEPFRDPLQVIEAIIASVRKDFGSNN